MAALPSIHHISGLPDNMEIIQLLDKNVPQIAIDFTTGKYVFTKPIMLKVVKVGIKQMLILVASVLIVGGAALGTPNSVAVGMGGQL